MTVVRDEEKWLLEQNAAEYLVEALNRQLGTDFRVVLHADRPDIVIEDVDTGQQIGVEVAHLFYDAEEARIFLGRSASDHHPAEDLATYLERLNKLLSQKADKARGYSHKDELALLIRVVSAVFGMSDFNRCEQLIQVPQSRYKFIWLLFYNWDSGKWDLIKALKQEIPGQA